MRAIILFLFALMSSALYAQEAAQDLFKTGTSLIKRGSYLIAATTLETADRLNPGDVGVACNLSAAYAYSGDIDRSIEQLKAAVDKEPIPARGILFYNLGTLQKKKGLLSEAEYSYNNSIYFLPYFAPSYLQLGKLYLRTGENEKAKDYFSIGNSMDNFIPDLGEKEIKEGMTGYMIILEGQDSEPELFLYHSPAWHLAIAINYKNNHKPSDAKEEIKQAIAALDKNSLLASDRAAFLETHITLGNIYLEEQNYDSALEEFRLAYGINSRHLGVITSLGYTFFLKGDPEGALRYCREAEAINKDYQPIQKLKKIIEDKKR